MKRSSEGNMPSHDELSSTRPKTRSTTGRGKISQSKVLIVQPIQESLIFHCALYLRDHGSQAIYSMQVDNKKQSYRVGKIPEAAGLWDQFGF